jgi:GntR family transcriptional regulator, arabinose operon transcriptional repressor
LTDINKESLHIRVKQLIRKLIDDERPEYLASERELQREFNISRTTIRKALNELMQEKRLIAEHGKGYRVLYDVKGRKLSGKIGFALLNDDDVFVNAVFREMIDEVFSKKFEPVVTIIDLRYENPAEKLSKLLAVTDAVFINSSILCEHHDVLPKTELFRCLALPYAVKNVAICSIMADMKQGARLLTRHLLDNGHRKIATLFTDSERAGGFELAMNKQGIEIDNDLQKNCHGYRHVAYKAMGDLLARRKDFTALICQNDIAALGAIEQCFKQGIKVPQDISIVGFDNIQESELFPVPLTTAGIDLKILCKKALNLLLDGLRTGESQKALKLKPKLITRQSVRNII